jgi:hypothetical protein
MPLDWSSLLDMSRQIGCLGFVLFVLWLQWPELQATTASAASLIKPKTLVGVIWRWKAPPSPPFLSYCGGEGKQSGAAIPLFRWFLPDGGSSPTIASKPVATPVAILPRLSLAMEANLKPPNRRLLSVLFAGTRRLDAAKWFVPGSLKVASDDGFSRGKGCSSALALLLGGDALRTPVAEIPRVLIAFPVSLLGCFLQKYTKC